MAALGFELLNRIASVPAGDREWQRILRMFAYYIPFRITIRELAEKLSLLQTALEQRFRERLSLTPQQHFIRLKMETATHLLAASQSPVKQIAARVGYEDPLAFSREFRKYSGLSPHNYRKAMPVTPP